MKAGALLALAGLALAGCAPAARHGEAAGARPTIVSINPCADAILAEVADPAQILAISHYSHDPRASSMPLDVARRFRSTGGTVEEVLALKPKVVVAGTFLPPAARAAFERLGMRVETFGIEHDLGESLAQVRQLAAVAGHPARGEALARRMERAVAEAAPPPGARPVSAILWQSSGIVPGPDALISDLMHRTGFASQSAARGLRQADVLPLEHVLADPPAVILAAATPGAGETRMLDHPALAALHGTRRARFDAGLLYCGGPTVIRAVRRLADIRREIGA